MAWTTSDSSVVFQFTPPRGGRPDEMANYCRGRKFQFTPPRGGRLQVPGRNGLLDVFQFTPPRGGRRVVEYVHFLHRLISIHAPAWGATSRSCREAPSVIDFNSRPRVGGDAGQTSGLSDNGEFQFTPPRGGRPDRPCRFPGRFYFNSRPRVGGRPHSVIIQAALHMISIHAPSGGRPASAI